jgi:hypothetical protein
MNMLRLTLCSSIDGRFLARVIDRDGHPFVLDFGDPRMIRDVSQRIHRGFTRFRFGRLIMTDPQDPNMLVQLADYYCGEGFLAFLEEPTWEGHQHAGEDRSMRLWNARSSAMAEPLDGTFEHLALPEIEPLDDLTEEMSSEDDDPTEDASRGTELPGFKT